MNVNKTMFVLGLLIVLIAAALLLLDVIESGVAAAVGMLGIGVARCIRSQDTQSALMG